MKDGRTHLAHKAEARGGFGDGRGGRGEDPRRGRGDTTTSHDTLTAAAEQIEAVVPDGDGLEEVVADKGYHSNQALVDLGSGRCAQLHLGT